MRGGFPSFHPLYHPPTPPPHDFSHKITENGHFIWCATSPSVQWVIASYKAVHRQWVKTSKVGARFLPSTAWVWRFPPPSWGPRNEWCQSKPLRSCQSLHCPPPATEKQQRYGANTTMVKEDWMTQGDEGGCWFGVKSSPDFDRWRQSWGTMTVAVRNKNWMGQGLRMGERFRNR